MTQGPRPSPGPLPCPGWAGLGWAGHSVRGRVLSVRREGGAGAAVTLLCQAGRFLGYRLTVRDARRPVWTR